MKLVSFDKILFRNYMYLIIGTALLISLFSAVIDVRNTLNNEKQNMYESLEQAQININKHTQMIDDYLTLTHSNSVLQTRLNQLKEKPDTTLLNDVNDILFAVDLFKKNLDTMQVFAYDESGFLPSFSSANKYSNALFSAQSVQDEQWFQQTLKKNGHTYWYVDTITFKQPTLCGSRIIYDHRSLSKMQGVIRANISIEKLIRHLGAISFGEKGCSMILFDGQLYQPQTNTSEYIVKHYISQKESLQKTHLLVEFPVVTSGFKVIGIMNKYELYKNTLQNLLSIVLVLVLSIILAIFLSSKNSRRISFPINQLCKNMAEMIGIENEGSYNCIEIHQLYTTYNAMLVKNVSLIQFREEAVMKLKQAEMAALQSQINPHFIYNTLESVNALIAIEDTNHALQMVTGLSNFLRSSLNNGNNFIPLEKEVEQVSSYFQIQKLRFSNQIALLLELPDPIPNYRIIKLILQPLVENSIIHGFKDLENTGMITITVQETKNNLVLSVADNGWGSDIEMLNYLVKQRTLYKEDNLNFYCIQNIYQRLLNCYGKGFSFTYSENKYGGVTAMIRIEKNVLII